MTNSPELPQLFEDDINLNGLFDILNPENNLVLADDMMLSDAEGVILWVSENYEKNFGFAHGSIVGKSAFDLEQDGTFNPCITAEVLRQKKKITTTQTINRVHKNVMTVGIPLFDKAGALKYAVCFNTVSMEQINVIQQNYRNLQNSLQQYTQEIAELRIRATSTSIVVKSAAMQRLWTLIQNTANTKANILITGETGVGKSAIAKAIHNMSSRANGPFIEVNCAVLHENLIESELFGYEKGAFTGAASGGKIGKIELANHGTLFLDEIGELPHHIQSKLLQLIQEKTIERLSGTRRIELDFRLLVATNRNLEEEVQRGLFRSDLFYRLNVIRIHIPPLRQRPEDILPLAHQFLERFCGEYGKQLALSPRFVAFLEQYPWPGNVRQLENLMERLVITAQDPILDVTALPVEFTGGDTPLPAPTGTLAERMDAFEGQIIRDSYRRCGTTVAVAKELGISQATAARKIAKYVKMP
ncbi:sigma-54 interaction domain-containing protein [Neopoerus faecalis]|uniref:sigma-54 interaction domain-containing protein n=1 Tax=Neopoerus faecalis TaxID=3032125 RepID=UPI0025706A46|nr:sigma 54-interacting transcriptional regulator [Neopoerus faecalis]